MISILTTACGSMFMPGFFRCLYDNGEREIRITGVDVAPVDYMVKIIDAFYQVPPYNHPDYLDAILTICRRENIDIIFPQISGELELFAANKKMFEDYGIRIAISNYETLRIANNKLALYDRMSECGLDTPAYFRVSDAKEFDIALNSLGYPYKNVCIKIADGSGQRGVRIVTENVNGSETFLHNKPGSILISYREMRTIIEELKGKHNLIAMQALHMPEYTVDLLAERGSTLYIGGRMNIESSMSIAQKSITQIIPEAFELSRQIVHELKLDGNIGFDFMFDDIGNVKLTDLNPRITATIVLFKEAGINFPYLRVKQLLGEMLPECHLKEGVTLIRKYNDIILQ